MAYTLRYKHGSAMAVAELSALAFVETAAPVLAEIEEHTRKNQDRRLLINLLDVVGTLEPHEQRSIAMLAAPRLTHLERVATLVPPDKIEHLRETESRIGGVHLKLFTNLTEAVSWLLE